MRLPGTVLEKVVLETLGPKVQASVYEILERSGIRKDNVASRFGDVVLVMTTTLGTCSRVVIHRTVVEMFKVYSQRLDFSYSDSLKDRLTLLKEPVVSNHVLPRRLCDESAFDSTERPELSEVFGGPVAHQTQRASSQDLLLSGSVSTEETPLNPSLKSPSCFMKQRV